MNFHKSASSVANSNNHWSSSPMSATNAANFNSNPNNCNGGNNNRTNNNNMLAFVQV